MKVSIVIPMYNSMATIVEVVESVVAQTHEASFEIIIVNDGSTDGCDRVVGQLIEANQSNRVIRLINKVNGGVSSARNAGVLEAAGDWIAFLDSDDIWFPEKLEKQIIEIKKNPSIKFVGTNRNGEIYPYFNKNKRYIYSLSAKEVILKWYPHTSTVLVCKSCLLEAGLYDCARTHAEDGDLWLKLAQYYKLYILNEDLVYTGGGKRTFGVSGLSANLSKMYRGEIFAIKGALKRKQINPFEYMAFYVWLSVKYIRRVLIVKREKLINFSY